MLFNSVLSFVFNSIVVELRHKIVELLQFFKFIFKSFF